MRELAAGVDSAELVEWEAYANLEPFGPLHEDFRAGQICAASMNPHRRADADPLRAADFMPALMPPEAQAAGPVLLEDPEAQSRLIAAALFKET